MMIEFKILFLDCVIGRRCISNTASSLWPCQKHYLKRYLTGMVFFLLAFLQVAQVGGKETAAPAGLLPETESASPNTPAPMTDIHDIQPPVSVGIEAPWLVPVLLALAAAAILALGWWFWIKRKKDRTIQTIVPELPPEMTAMQALDQISDVRRLDGKTFYFRLSAILRQYVFGRYAVGAPEMTTEEFMPCIDRMNMDHHPGPTAERPLPGHGSGKVRRRNRCGKTDGNRPVFCPGVCAQRPRNRLTWKRKMIMVKNVRSLPMNDKNSKNQIPNLK
jgi:hypothetical protein